MIERHGEGNENPTNDLSSTKDNVHCNSCYVHETLMTSKRCSATLGLRGEEESYKYTPIYK